MSRAGRGNSRLPQARSASLTKSKAERVCRRQVSITDIRTPWAAAPAAVRLPPQTLRLTTAGRIAGSAGLFVAGTDGVVKNENHDSAYRSRWSANAC